MKLSNLAKKMIFRIVAIAVAFILLSVIYHRSLAFVPFLYGALLGTAISISKVFLLERAVNHALEMGQERAGSYVNLQHVLRLLLTGVVLFLGAIVPQISLWGVAAGIISFQLAVYGLRFSER